MIKTPQGSAPEENPGILPISLANSPEMESMLKSTQNGQPSPVVSDSVFGQPTQPVTPTQQKPATQLKPAEHSGYVNAGNITMQQVINGNVLQYAHLDEIIINLVEEVQKHLVENQFKVDESRYDAILKAKIISEIDRLVNTKLVQGGRTTPADKPVIIASVINEIIGLGPIEPIWQDSSITEVIVNGPNEIYIEQAGKLIRARGIRFRNQDHLLEICTRIVGPLGRKIDVSSPMVDARLPDGSRVNAVHFNIAPRGPLLSIRRFPEVNRSLVDLVTLGAMTADMACTLAWLVANKASTLVVGGTGTGKALDVETPIPTPNGFVRMGDLRLGDIVFDENGKQISVTGAYDTQYNRPCYEVKFSDGTSIVADAEHLWKTETLTKTLRKTLVGKSDIRLLAYSPYYSGEVKTTLDIKETLLDPTGKYFNHSILLKGQITSDKEKHNEITFATNSSGDIVRYIIDVVEVESRPVRCIRVSSESHLFLAGKSFIPTHNTTLLNALSAAIPRNERVITIEDSLELRLHPSSHVAAMEARPPDARNENAILIKDLVKNALRMRPDRIIVGEVRGEEALNMLEACNTGHEGSMSTIHANGSNEALARLAVMIAQGGEMPSDKVDWLVGSALDLMIQIKRYKDGSRRVSGVYEVPDIFTLQPGQPMRTIPLWEWKRIGEDANGKYIGEYHQINEVSQILREKLALEFEPIFTWDQLQSICQY